MATHTDRIMVISPEGLPTRVSANDTIELSSGNLKVGGDITTSGSVIVETEETVNLSANSVDIISDTPDADGYAVEINAEDGDIQMLALSGKIKIQASDNISINSGGNVVDVDAYTDSIDVDAVGVFGVAALSSNFILSANSESTFLIEDTSGNDYLKVKTITSSEEIVFGNSITNPDFNFSGSGSLVLSIFQASENIYAGQALCLASASTVGIADAATQSKAHIVGIALENVLTGNSVKMIAIPGVKALIKTNLSGSPSVGSEVYLSQTPGDFTTTPPSSPGTIVFKAGYVLTINQILFQPQFIRVNN